MERVKYIPNEFEQYLNDVYDEIEILGMTFTPARILRDCDPIAYRIYLQDFTDEMEKEANE
jgi:hypothetical protein